MLFYSLYFVCFLAILAAKTGPEERLSSEIENSEQIFAEVIKNISRVNNVLQELISNYEQLQKIYKSQENVDAPEYSSEENDPYFKNNKKFKRERDLSNAHFYHYTPSERITAAFLHGTQLIMSENEETDNSYETPTTTTRENKAETPAVDRQTVERKPNVLKTIIKEKISPSADVISRIDDTINPTTKASTTTAYIINPIQPSAAKIIFVDTHKKMQEKIEKRKPRIMPEIELERTVEKRPRSNIKEMPVIKDVSYVVTKPQRNNRNATKSTTKKFLHTQLFTKNATLPRKETDGKLKKPVIVEKYTNVKPAETAATPQVVLKSQTIPNKNTKIIVVNGVRTDDNVDSSSETTDVDESLNKDMFKTSVLRQAYGDACQKLVIRKCYKACKKALTTSCRATKCKGGIKNLFDRSSRTGCIEQFNSSRVCGHEINPQNEEQGDDGELRSGLLLSLPWKQEVGMHILRKAQTGHNDQYKDKELNILRDRYERACQKISQRKCRKACKYAEKTTCAKFQCAKNLKKNLKRNCVVRCKIAYRSRNTGGRDSDSDSESGDDSDSDDSDSS